MKKLLLLLFLISSGGLFAQQQTQINWLSFEQLSDSLAIKPKKVLLFFHTDWCSFCRKMQNEVFTDQHIIDKINTDYYAVQFDAESVDSVHFDNQVFINPVTKKRTGKYHQLTTLLAAQKGKYIFPTTILLDADFTIKARFFQYLGRDKLNGIL